MVQRPSRPGLRGRRSAGRRSSRLRSFATTGAVAAGAILIALVGTGTSYALWNGNAVTTATAQQATVASGSTGLTINNLRNFSIAQLNLKAIGPGQSVITSTPLTVANTGTTKLSASVVSAAVTANSALAAELTVTVTKASACTVGQSGGTSGRITGFTTASAPFVLQPAGQAGSSAQVCVQITMDLDAPMSVKNQSTSFTLNFEGKQVR